VAYRQIAHCTAIASELKYRHSQVLPSSLPRLTMKLSRVQWNILIVVSLVAGAAWTVASRVPGAQALRGVLARATPDISLSTLDGGTFRLAAQRGKPVIVNFWATWCLPCRAELPAFEQVHKSHRDDGLVIVGVDVAEPSDVVAKYVAEMGLTFPIAIDEDGEVSELYRVQGLPTTIFVGRDGTIRDVIIGGPLSKAAIESKVADLMKR
jgi:thiol-disulfide isomerase/thioredoxin